MGTSKCKFGYERFAVMSEIGEWNELESINSMSVESESASDNSLGIIEPETTITLTLPTEAFEKALYDRRWKIKMKDYESTHANYGLFKVIPNYLKVTMEIPFVENVIINPPATIVFWNDGTKTVCKCAKGDTFDAEKGIAMCFLKKMFGNSSQVRKFMKMWIPWMVISRVKQKDVMDNRKAYNGNSTMVTLQQ